MGVPYLGRFMSYEVVTDLRHTWLLRKASDILSWASAGPGCARGLEWIFPEEAPLHYGSKKDQERMLDMMRELLSCSRDKAYWQNSQWLPPWEMREVEHVLCEYDKYRRGKAGQRLKRKYRVRTEDKSAE
jgi:hypothetical protein